MRENYHASNFNVSDGYLYRTDGHNHKSRMAISSEDYDYLDACQKECTKNEYIFDSARFNESAIIVWKKTLKREKPEHFTIRRNKK